MYWAHRMPVPVVTMLHSTWNSETIWFATPTAPTALSENPASIITSTLPMTENSTTSKKIGQARRNSSRRDPPVEWISIFFPLRYDILFIVS